MTPAPLRDLILRFYADLERLGRRHPDLTDPEVTEALHLTGSSE